MRAGCCYSQLCRSDAGGVEYGYLDDNMQFIQKFDAEEQDFLEQDATQQYLAGAINDYVNYNNVVPEIVFNEPKTKVLAIRHINAGENRWQLQNEITGKIDHSYLSKNWNRHIGINPIIVSPTIKVHFLLEIVIFGGFAGVRILLNFEFN